MADEQTPWVVKGVSADTRKKVKLYAVQKDLTMAEAVTELVEKALTAAPIQRPARLLPLPPDAIDTETLRTAGYLKEAIFDWGVEWFNAIERPSLRQFLEAINAIRCFPLDAASLEQSRAIFLERLEQWTPGRKHEHHAILRREMDL